MFIVTHVTGKFKNYTDRSMTLKLCEWLILLLKIPNYDKKILNCTLVLLQEAVGSEKSKVKLIVAVTCF